ncbi:hypothetical protein NtRootA4_25810 [Arthrobacter sp. NtRootA4]|nr:hypothetical protein NtRootA2_27990 [Arthrobacter sp. NtRootA2]BCW15602.1 hypothetical protein NtRootA4_25810 [Arthrobacter sp. NtRootA4]BCW23936.1 hypothetical protein NtRootC7_28030 [Arthrobacter sp. NtRootC7]BCW28204.1 hypothetical protein NtRootC45_28040 [Arthrobacter sp. NtRootC45]BCW32474.1 hypothetical protein NtRootD5_28050 [Arthrobacter sp. NtRootD5]
MLLSESAAQHKDNNSAGSSSVETFDADAGQEIWARQDWACGHGTGNGFPEPKAGKSLLKIEVSSRAKNARRKDNSTL